LETVIRNLHETYQCRMYSRKLLMMGREDARNMYYYYYYYYYYCRYSALGPVWTETRAQSDDWYGSGTLHPGHVLRGILPLLSP